MGDKIKMKLLLEQWREYLLESVEDLKHISVTPWSSQEAKHEWGEEVNTSLEEGDEYIAQRWPGLSRKVIEKHYPELEIGRHSVVQFHHLEQYLLLTQL